MGRRPSAHGRRPAAVADAARGLPRGPREAGPPGAGARLVGHGVRRPARRRHRRRPGPASARGGPVPAGRPHAGLPERVVEPRHGRARGRGRAGPRRRLHQRHARRRGRGRRGRHPGGGRGGRGRGRHGDHAAPRAGRDPRPRPGLAAQPDDRRDRAVQPAAPAGTPPGTGGRAAAGAQGPAGADPVQHRHRRRPAAAGRRHGRGHGQRPVRPDRRVEPGPGRRHLVGAEAPPQGRHGGRGRALRPGTRDAARRPRRGGARRARPSPRRDPRPGHHAAPRRAAHHAPVAAPSAGRRLPRAARRRRRRAVGAAGRPAVRAATRRPGQGDRGHRPHARRPGRGGPHRGWGRRCGRRP